MKHLTITFLIISILSLIGCQANKEEALPINNQTEEKSDDILIIERAAPFFGRTFTEYKTLQAEWNNSKKVSISSQLNLLKDNEPWFSEFGVSVTTIEDGVKFFDNNEDAIKESIKLKSKAKAAKELASDKYSEMFIKEEKAKLLGK